MRLLAFFLWLGLPWLGLWWCDPLPLVVFECSRELVLFALCENRSQFDSSLCSCGEAALKGVL